MENLEKRDKLVEIFIDTRDKSKRLFSYEIESSLLATKIYEKDVKINLPLIVKPNQNIVVTNSGSVETARNNQNGKIAILNFASAFRPGGGVENGAIAQEETLCRCSFLYEILSSEKCVKNYYSKNKNERKLYGSDRIIYSPDVVFLKSDKDEFPTNIKPFKADVITCAAPNLRNKDYDKKELEKILYFRYKNIFKLAYLNKVDNLILGAIGCGVFKNPAHIVAKVMLDLCNKFNCFKNIIFPIYKSQELFDIFKEVLG